MDNDTFLNKMIENMKKRNGKGDPLGSYIQNLLSNVDYSFANLVKIIELMNYLFLLNFQEWKQS